MPIKVNPIFIPNQDQPKIKPFCSICARYMVYTNSGNYYCPMCGAEYHNKEVDNDDNLESIHDSKPMIVSKPKSKERRSADYPVTARIIKEIEYLPNGSSREIEYD